MKILIPVFLVILFCGRTVQAQTPEDLLNSWSDKSPVEKVYLHFDRDNYLAGETMWFKGYLYSDFYPDTISTTLYVELLNASSVIVSKKVLPVAFGNTKGQVELPDSLSTGHYFVRAYSPTMLNHAGEFLFSRRLHITGKNPGGSPVFSGKKTRIEFFPESGNFVSDMPNTIAFKVTDESGLPLHSVGIVRSERGDSITEFSSYHDGMGMFDINPSKGIKYYVQLKGDPSAVKYDLPAVSGIGLVFRLMPNPLGRYFEIYQRPDNPSFRAAYIIGQMQHRQVFRMELNPEKNDLIGLINTQKLNSGILHVTVFNKEGMPLAERLCFVDNKEYRQTAQLLTDTVNFSGRMKNHFTLSFPDTIGGSFSVAITDPDYAAESQRSENIISSLLLTSDLKGYVHNPIYYFSSDDDSVKNALDILMMIHGWRRFKWSELPGISKQALRYQDPGYITITGKVNIRDTRKPLSNKDLFLLIFPMEDSLNSSMQFMNTNEEGRFRLDSLVFFGKTRFFVSDMLGKKNKWLDLYPDSDSINTSFGLPSLDIKQYLNPAATIPDSISSRLAYDYAAILNAEGQMLGAVTLKVRKKSPVQELEERYASGLFSGLSEKTIDLVNTKEKITQNNIFDYIQGRVPGIKVQKNGFNYQLFYRQRFSLTGGAIPMILYLNEMQTDARLISTIPASQVSMIKIFSSFFGAEGNGTGGVLAIYTKQGADLNNSLSTSADIFMYKGYSITKEFYSPDYSVPVKTDSASQKDHRVTLHWQPDIYVDGGDTKVPVVFYNNDRSRRFKVIVEGMTSEGKMVFIEKIISPSPRPF